MVRGLEIDYRKPDGAIQPVEINASVVDSGSGPIILTLVRDITERKRAEDALKESEKFLNNVVENIPDMIFVKDAKDLRFVRFNKAGEDLLGFSREELYGKNDYDFFPKDEADFFIRKDREVLENRQLVDIPEEMIQTRLKGGRILHTKKIPIIDESGKPGYLMGISEDITERKRAEDALRKSGREWQTTFNAITDAIFLLDGRGKIIRHNHAFETFTGKPADEIDGKYCHEVMHGTASPVEWCPNMKAQKSRQRESIELKIGNRWFIIAVDPIFSEDSTFSGAVHLLIDITERKLAEVALNQASKKLNLLNAITFSDIQNSIFSLSGYFELEMLMPMDEKLRQYRESEKKIVQNIAESLKFTTIYQSLGIKPLEWQNVQQSFLLGISHLNISSLSRRLEVSGVEIYADPLLENVFFELAENVIMHGRTATELTLRYQESSDGLILFFEDNGTGIPDELKEKIFERGYGRRKGLGLFLTREILSITGITIRETGEAGTGARFEILVPKESYRFTTMP
jgi:PAS domain S-box-containing protein